MKYFSLLIILITIIFFIYLQHEKNSSYFQGFEAGSIKSEDKCKSKEIKTNNQIINSLNENITTKKHQEKFIYSASANSGNDYTNKWLQLYQEKRTDYETGK